MGSMQCCRKGCGAHGCQTYVEDIGYMCYPCKSEFADNMKVKYDGEDQKKSVIISELKAFIQTKKDDDTSKVMSIDEFFNIHL